MPPKQSTSSCIPPNPNPTPSTSSYIPPNPNPTPSTSSYIPPNPNPTPSTSSCIPPNPNPTPSTSSYIPPNPNPTPSTSSYIPPNPNPTPSTSSYIPPNPNPTPSTSSYIPPNPNPTPSTSSYIPPNPNPTPSTSSCIPPNPNPTPSTSSYIPPNPNPTPSTSSCIPPNPNPTPSTSSYIPPNPNPTPSTSSCIPPNPNPTPSTSSSPLVSKPNPSTSTQQMGIQSYLRLTKVPDSVSRKVDQQLVRMIVKEYQPLSLVEDTEFKKFLELVSQCPNYKLPTRKTITEGLIPTLYERKKQEVKMKLASASAVCLTTDSWTSSNSDSFLAVTAHFVQDQPELASYLLGCISLTEKHTSVNLADALETIAKDYDIHNKIAGHEQLATNTLLCTYYKLSCEGWIKR
ncbi:hypothetical protein M8J76_016315 [Diaphorina citri]|nr:hypothetical protein M8J76_016315 [Diaphorina citri]